RFSCFFLLERSGFFVAFVAFDRFSGTCWAAAGVAAGATATREQPDTGGGNDARRRPRQATRASRQHEIKLAVDHSLLKRRQTPRGRLHWLIDSGPRARLPRARLGSLTPGMSLLTDAPDLATTLELDADAPRAARHLVGRVDSPAPDLRDAVVLLKIGSASCREGGGEWG